MSIGAITLIMSCWVVKYDHYPKNKKIKRIWDLKILSSTNVMTDNWTLKSASSLNHIANFLEVDSITETKCDSLPCNTWNWKRIKQRQRATLTRLICSNSLEVFNEIFAGSDSWSLLCEAEASIGDERERIRIEEMWDDEGREEKEMDTDVTTFSTWQGAMDPQHHGSGPPGNDEAPIFCGLTLLLPQNIFFLTNG